MFLKLIVASNLYDSLSINIRESSSLCKVHREGNINYFLEEI